MEVRSVLVIALLLSLGLGGCAAGRAGSATGSDYTGVFTGEYVDGKPLYRFPPIHVVGSRSGIADPQ